jgi:hypothetical protein
MERPADDSASEPAGDLLEWVSGARMEQAIASHPTDPGLLEDLRPLREQRAEDPSASTN